MSVIKKQVESEDTNVLSPVPVLISVSNHISNVWLGAAV